MRTEDFCHWASGSGRFDGSAFTFKVRQSKKIPSPQQYCYESLRSLKPLDFSI